MNKLEAIQQHNIYLLGAGGIGMSALARHFKNMGKLVAGYDKTPTPLTHKLIEEGVDIHFEDSINLIPEAFLDKENTLVIYTPAVPSDQTEFIYFKNHGYNMVKRANTLGKLVNSKKGIAIAGTHGKTSTSTITAYLLRNSAVNCSAFLGGISKNFESNYLFSESSDYIVVEADEYDRSFLHLHPYITIVTAIDPDHMEIYLNRQNIIDSFNMFIRQTHKTGYLLLNSKIENDVEIPDGPTVYTYSLHNAASSFYVSGQKLVNGLFEFNLQTPFGEYKNLTLGIPGNVNLENAVAAMAASLLAGVKSEDIKNSLPQLKGVKRRLDILFRNKNTIYMDDYAHHPEEIRRMLESVREIFPDKKITGIFQPHLYSRTRDFANEFAKSLSLLNELILLDIYPARELPIPGITSEIIFNAVECQVKFRMQKEDVLNHLIQNEVEVLITIGAGDIDTLIQPIVELFKTREIEKV